MASTPGCSSLPALRAVVLFSVYPLLRGIYLGFTDAQAGLNVTTTSPASPTTATCCGDDLFWESFRIGLIWAFGVTVLQFLAALGLALLLNLDLQAALAGPDPRAGAVGDAAGGRRHHVAAGLHPRRRPSTASSGRSGFAGTINWLGDFSTALPAVIVVGVWAGMPQTTITLLAGLQRCPRNCTRRRRSTAPVAGGGSARHAARAAAGDRRHHHAQLHLELQLVRPGLRADRRRPGRQDDAADALRLHEAFRYGHFGYAAAMGNVMVDRRRPVPRRLPPRPQAGRPE